MEKPNCSVSTCDRPTQARGWCQAHYMRWWGYGNVDADRPLARQRQDEKARFTAYYVVAGNGCWLWQGRLDRGGYAHFTRTGEKRAQFAHRAAYEMFVGPIPDGLHIDHVCHTQDRTCLAGTACEHRRCVNPSHLEAVEPAENVRRGRSGLLLVKRAQAITHCPQGHPYSAENTYINPASGGRGCRECARVRNRSRSYRSRGLPDPRRKITDDQIESVRALADLGLSLREVQRRTGVHTAAVQKIWTGRMLPHAGSHGA